jgi:rod shape-determining protein MreC
VPRASVARNSTLTDLSLLGVSAGIAILATVLPRNVSDPVAGAFRRTIVAPLVALQARAERSRDAFYAHDAVTAKTDSAALRAATANALVSENERLRQLLGLGGRVRWGFVVAEALHMGGPADQNSVTLTVGSAAGIAPRSPVVAPEGVVGIVQQVDPTTSRAILWSHADFRVSAMTIERTALGIVQPHIGGLGDEYLELRNVALRDTLAPGTLLVSSGLGSAFPRGIPVGTVVRELETPEKWARSYLLRPAVPAADVQSVMVLRPERVAAGVSDVWASAAAADAAARRIVVASDSAVRDSAQAAQRAQFVADSVRIARAAAAAASSAARDSAAAAAGAAAGTPPATTPAVPATPPARPAPARPARARPATTAPRDSGFPAVRQ